MVKHKKAVVVAVIVILLAAVIGLFFWYQSLQPHMLGPGDFPEPNPMYVLC